MKDNTIIHTQLCKVENTSIDEQELSIVIERNSDKMVIYTSDNTWITKLNKLILQNPVDYKIVWTNASGSLVEAPANLLTLRTMKKTMNLSEEQKQIRGDRLRKLKSKK